MGKQTNTVTPNPPIFTADEHIIAVGDILYGVDTACNDKEFPTVTPLQVIQLYLGSYRRVSLRKKNGIEWSWSPKEERAVVKLVNTCCTLNLTMLRKLLLKQLL